MVHFIKTTSKGTLVSDKPFTASTKERKDIHGFTGVWTGRQSNSSRGKLGFIFGKPKKALKQGAELAGFHFTSDVLSEKDGTPLFWVAAD